MILASTFGATLQALSVGIAIVAFGRTAHGQRGGAWGAAVASALCMVGVAADDASESLGSWLFAAALGLIAYGAGRIARNGRSPEES